MSEYERLKKQKDEIVQKEKLKQIESQKEEMRKIIWQKTMMLTIEMQHKKSQFLKGKYSAFKEIWDELGGDIQTIESKEK
jgi:hypothetical protein